MERHEVVAVAAPFARRQLGVVTISQLRAAGLAAGDIDEARRPGRGLITMGRGVYRLGPVPDDEVDRWRQHVAAALLRAGSDWALANHTAAAWFGWDACPRLEAVRLTRVAAAAGVHQTPCPRGDTVRGGPRFVTVTSPARTLLDIAARHDRTRLEWVVEAAERRNRGTIKAVEARLAAHRGWGVSTLRKVLADRPPGAPATESELESRCAQLIRSLALPHPVRQHQVTIKGQRRRLDFAWPEIRLYVEVDGEEYHLTKQAFRSDRRRQNGLVTDGWEPIVLTWDDIVLNPVETKQVILDAYLARRRELAA